MKIKSVFLLLLMISFVPAISAAYADPSPSLRVVVAENEFTEDEGNVLLMPTITGSPTALELGLFPVPHPDEEVIFPNDAESYNGDVYAVDGFDGFGKMTLIDINLLPEYISDTNSCSFKEYIKDGQLLSHYISMSKQQRSARTDTRARQAARSLSGQRRVVASV